VVTLGCSKNIYDSEVLMGQLKANNKEVAHEEEGNIVVIIPVVLLPMRKRKVSIPFFLMWLKKRQEK